MRAPTFGGVTYDEARDGERLSEQALSDLKKRFWKKVRIGSPLMCWEWTGHLVNGYGRIRVGRNRGSRGFSHRIAYVIAIGPIPTGLIIDHLCRVRHCVNPLHLEPVTSVENVMRGVSLPAKLARQTRCQCGRAYDAIDARGSRRCTKCTREYKHTYNRMYHAANRDRLLREMRERGARRRQRRREERAQ